MTDLDPLFKFRIGQEVQHITTKEGDIESRFFVIERVLQECPGGVQMHYKCRPFGMGMLKENWVHKDIFTLNEIELKACD